MRITIRREYDGDETSPLSCNLAESWNQRRFLLLRVTMIVTKRKKLCGTVPPVITRSDLRSVRSVMQVFFTRDSICYSAYRFATPIPSVRPSVTRVYCIKTAERIIEILSASDMPIILVFEHQRSLRKSDGFTPNGGAKYKGVTIFDQYAAISRKW